MLWNSITTNKILQVAFVLRVSEKITAICYIYTKKKTIVIQPKGWMQDLFLKSKSTNQIKCNENQTNYFLNVCKKQIDKVVCYMYILENSTHFIIWKDTSSNHPDSSGLDEFDRLIKFLMNNGVKINVSLPDQLFSALLVNTDLAAPLKFYYAVAPMSTFAMKMEILHCIVRAKMDISILLKII